MPDCWQRWPRRLEQVAFRGASGSAQGPRARRGRFRQSEIRRQQNRREVRWSSRKIARHIRREKRGRQIEMLSFARGDASSWLPQDPVCRFRKIFRYKIGLRGPFRGMPSQFTFTISRAHEDAPGANIAGQLDVAVAVTYDERPRQI